MAENDMLFPGFLHDKDMPEWGTRRNPIPYPYSQEQKYDARQAFRQGTLFPWLDDHWRSRIGRADLG